MNWITNWVLKRKSATILIMIITLLFGTFAVTQLKSELLPNISVPYLAVTTVYPGANSELVADKVSKPVENVISQLPRLKNLRSTSQESFSLVTAEFEFGTNMKDVQQTLTNKLKTLSLPSRPNGQALQPTLADFNFNSQAILELTLEGLKGQSGETLTKWAQEVGQPALSKLTDVSNVEVVGGTKQLLNVSFRPKELAEKGITLDAVVNTLQSVSLSYPAGVANADGLSLPTNVVYTFKSPEEMGNLVITPGFSNAPVSETSGQSPPAIIRLKDVADIKLSPNQSNGISRINGNPGIQLEVYKTQSGNTVVVSDGVLKKIEEFNRQYPDVKVSVIYDQAGQIRKSVEGLAKEGLLGAVFAVLVIFLFLRNVRSTLVTAISIPTSVILAFILLWTQNITLNIMTLGGLAVAIGRVVDDAIVVLENIYRRAQIGEPIPDAVKNGTAEVAGAITSSTLTTVAVFLPLGFVGGLTSQFFLPFALTVSFALLASLLVALTIIPVFASFLLRRKNIKVKAGAVHEDENDGLLQRIYYPTLKWSLRHRALTLMLAFMLFVGSLASVYVFQIPFAFLPESGDKLVSISVNPGPGSDQKAVLTLTDKVEKVLGEYKSKGTISLYQSTLAGDSEFARTQQAVSGSTGASSILVRLSSATKTGPFVKELDSRLKPLAPKGGDISVANEDGFGGGNTFSLTVKGPNLEAIQQASRQITEALKPISSLVNIRSDVSQLTPQVVITPDPTKNALANPAIIGGEIRNLLQGQNLGLIRFVNGQEVEVYLTLPRPDGATIDQYLNSLKQLQLVEGLKLGDIARVERVEAVNQITRINQTSAATISANITVDDTGGVNTEAIEKVQALKLPAGVTTSLSGGGQQQDEAFTGLALAILVAVALVYVVMVIAFGSLLEPFAILFSLPLALIGAVAALVITQKALGLPAMIGILMLIGIVVTNAIVLLDMVNQLRKRGYDRHEALLQAGRNRLRPILMTALATILALIPLAAGINEGSIIASELGTVVIGGLLSSTLLTLLVVPVVYSLLEGGKERLARLFKLDNDHKGGGSSSNGKDDEIDIARLLRETEQVKS